jgi:hypothetical protein
LGVEVATLELGEKLEETRVEFGRCKDDFALEKEGKQAKAIVRVWMVIKIDYELIDELPVQGTIGTGDTICVVATPMKRNVGTENGGKKSAMRSKGRPKRLAH